MKKSVKSMNEEKQQERVKLEIRKTEELYEKKHLEKTVQIIKENIKEYEAKQKEISAETEDLYDHYHSDNPELHNQLLVSLDMKGIIYRTLFKNTNALDKPYFGRIDYNEENDNQEFSLYIGKNGISNGNSDIIIIDWRAPVASVYYDSDLGESYYLSPLGERIHINLDKKRTFEIDHSQLIDFYDTDVVANDEFLTKYLAKNKEVILGEIIATIQKEQNRIIRDTPWHSIIVQGVAGSGKTTVAMHRISYILYNFKDKFRPEEFYIIGSNKILLNYITGVLPNLDVYNINQMTLEEFMLYMLDKDFNIKKRKFILQDSFSKIQPNRKDVTLMRLKRLKGTIPFVKALEQYLEEYETNYIPTKSVNYRGQIIYSSEEIKSLLHTFKDRSLGEKIDILNKRLQNKVKLKNEMLGEEKEVIRAEVKKYNQFFGKKHVKIDVLEVYESFILDAKEHREKYLEANIYLPEGEVFQQLLYDLDHKVIDIYDLSMLNFIKKKLKISVDYEDVNHIVVDEAQDFGVMAFYVLRQLFPKCTFTIMGDVSQNIYYDTGMNDWEALQNEVFSPEKDQFYVLAKSYRNTVEISNYASRVLRKCTFKTYEIEPIIRHGKEVNLVEVKSEEDMVQETVRMLKEIQEEGYNTTAVICRTVEETLTVSELLRNHVKIEQLEKELDKTTFTNGIMVLPIHMTKGLEFDSVILWNPDTNRYEESDADAKLLYVAITRALHELHIVYQGELSRLLQ
ncbi:HelD family protein [Anaeromicropila herbilytica]|uniref:DNA helicase n=1 Tax=Anaeromicropila herbilytica TaxID=2785025 RepID=A0A7R7EL05_9FIRM|nr:3'-5' exonuclease [Anaeromicropila herbilytica]BCN30526.1 DNA helicase [Anaeromicropila herbilytica]